MATTDLKLDEPGTLARPGPVGRLVRLIFGALCVFYVIGLFDISKNLLDSQDHIRSLVWNGVLPGLFLVSYVINIGFSRALKKWPAIISAAVLLLAAAYGYFSEGSYETVVLARTIWIWELYLFSHLGLSFLSAAVLATPGCEMRALHDLYARVSGKPAKEHVCPVGPLSAIDRWELSRK